MLVPPEFAEIWPALAPLFFLKVSSSRSFNVNVYTTSGPPIESSELPQNMNRPRRAGGIGWAASFALRQYQKGRLSGTPFYRGVKKKLKRRTRLSPRVNPNFFSELRAKALHDASRFAGSDSFLHRSPPRPLPRLTGER